MSRNNKDYQRSIRLTEDQGKQLERISEEIDLPVSAIISMAVKALLEAYALQGGQITLPLKFRPVTMEEYLHWKELLETAGMAGKPENKNTDDKATA